MVQLFLLAFFLQVNDPNYTITDSIQLMQEKKTVEAASIEEDTYVNEFKPYNIPLDVNVQKYIWEEANKYGLSFELLLAIAYVESNFDSKIISWDGSSTGLFQLNTRNTVHWISNELGIEDIDPKNPYHSTKMAVWYINYLREKYLSEGYDEETVTNRVLLAYRFGISGSKSRSINHPYVQAVLKYKNKLESGEYSE